MTELYENIADRENGRFFRLLTLYPTQSSATAITCELSIHALNPNAEYEALSYCWGDATDKQEVTCNGEPFMVTENLMSALKQLRLAHQPRTLWVDAMCINQSDLAERAHQVGFMRDIYKLAARVLIWLGPAYEESELVFPMCQRMAMTWVKLIRERGKDETWMMDQFEEIWARNSVAKSQAGLENRWSKEEWNNLPDLTSVRERVAQANGSGDMDDRVVLWVTPEGRDGTTGEEIPILDAHGGEYRALLRLLQRPWWTRSWVVQEICLAQKATVFCGNAALDWDVFNIAIIIMARESPDAHEFVPLSRGGALRMIRMRSNIEGADQSQPFGLLDLLQECRTLQSTDKKDKVYAFLGLLKPNDAAHQHIQANYVIDDSECYLQTAVACLSLSKNLDCLSVERSHTTGLASTLPSWVPDWSSASRSRPLPLQTRHKDESSTQSFRASGTSTRYSSPPDSIRELKLSGFVTDELVQVEEVLPSANIEAFMSSNEELGNKVIKPMIRFCDSLGRYLDPLVKWEKLATATTTGHKGEDPLRVLCATMCAGNLPAGLDAAFAAFMTRRTELKGPKRIAKLKKVGLDRFSKLYYPLVGYSAPTKALEYEDDADRAFFDPVKVAAWRRLARTRNGHLALVPEHARSGDQVALCRGCKVPLILRGGVMARWELVGCAYVHGIMYGEAWDEGKCQQVVLV